MCVVARAASDPLGILPMGILPLWVLSLWMVNLASCVLACFSFWHLVFETLWLSYVLFCALLCCLVLRFVLIVASRCFALLLVASRCCRLSWFFRGLAVMFSLTS